jgi:hypothetical protein
MLPILLQVNRTMAFRSLAKYASSGRGISEAIEASDSCRGRLESSSAVGYGLRQPNKPKQKLGLQYRPVSLPFDLRFRKRA